jgi:hypothetical protein
MCNVDRRELIGYDAKTIGDGEWAVLGGIPPIL